MLLPGPEAQQLAIYVGWLLHKTWGGIVAGGLFVLPSAVLLWALSYIYAAYGHVAWIAALFYGLKPAVLAIVASAVLRIGKRALKTKAMWIISTMAFVGIYVFGVPFPIIIFSAAVAGFVGGKISRNQFLVFKEHAGKGSESTVISDDAEAAEHTKPSLKRAAKVLGVCLLLWWAPVLVIGARLGFEHTVFHEGIFFSKASMVTFGGAYAVLPYVSQQAVEHYHWLAAGQMLDGLGLAETTPGPLIMVLQFVGFLGAWAHPGQLPVLIAATLGAFITTWTTFVPCFLWIFLGAPHIEQLRGNEKITTALSAVTAAVVGVVLNLAVWFGINVLFPLQQHLDWFALVVSMAAFAVMTKWKWDVVPVIFTAAGLGIAYKIIF
jgi:chromate transporter